MEAVSLPPPSSTEVTVQLSRGGGGGMKRLLGGTPKGPHQLTLTPAEVVVEHGMLDAPLRFAPGSVAAAAIDHGPASLPKDVGRGRFPVLHRLAPNRVIAREEGIEGWLWTSVEGSAFTVLTDEAPNVAFIFSPPVASERLEGAFRADMLGEIAKRSPLGQPALFGLLLRTEDPEGLAQAFDRYGFRRELTDREVPPTQRRHLPDDRPANPEVASLDRDRAKSSMPPPGMG